MRAGSLIHCRPGWGIVYRLPFQGRIIAEKDSLSLARTYFAGKHFIYPVLKDKEMNVRQILTVAGTPTVAGAPTVAGILTVAGKHFIYLVLEDREMNARWILYNHRVRISRFPRAAHLADRTSRATIRIASPPGAA